MPPLCITKGSAHPSLLAGYLFQSVKSKNFSCEEVLAKMDTKHQPTVEPTDEKPVAVAHLEDKSELGPDKHAGAVDYTGAEAKTDPEEIALVRKIDWRLMVSYSGKD